MVLAGLVALAAGLLGPGAPRAAARETPVVRVEVTAAEVAGTAPAETVTVSGTVTNGSADALTDVAVHLWRSTAVLRSGDALAAALAATEPPAGRWQPVKTENTAVLASGTQTLAPGDTRPFTVSGRLSDLGITSRDASYWVGADVRGRRGPGTSASTLGGDRTLITLPGADAAATVVTVVELSATPRVIKPGLFVDDGLTEELNGRLAQLLDAARTRAWVVDPALLDEVRDMADGYRVATENGTQPGAGQAAAQAWLAAFDALPDASGSVELFGRPDLTAALGLGETTLATTSARAGEPAPENALAKVAVLDAPDAATLAALAETGRIVIATGLDAPGSWLRVGATAVVAARRPGVAPDSPSLADTALNRAAVLTARARANGTQVRLLRTVGDMEADAAPLPAWAQRGTLAALLQTDATRWTPRADGDVDVPRGLDAATLPRVRALAAGLDAYAAAAPGAGVDTLADAQTARGASAWWAGNPVGQDRWLSAVDSRVGWAAMAQGITLSALPRFSMAGQTGDFPVTVTNSLTDAITVRLVATTDNPQRIRFADPPQASIDPGASEALVLRAEASGGGVVNALVHVETLDGRRLTPDAAIVVETTNVGVIGWVLVVSSAVVLLVTTVLRVRQVRAEQRGGADA